MPRSKLDETRDFVELFCYLGGDWTTPREFLQWSAISLIAACVEDRVWFNVFEHASLYPNVWVFLIGGSGTGKDHAVGMALSVLPKDSHLWMIDGKVTMPALYDYMARQQKNTGKPSAPVYLISSDVTEQLPLGSEAREFTSRSLALYGGRDRDLLDLTRTSGDKIVHNPLLNWCAGCTKDWFPMAIDPIVFNSGMAGRAFFIVGETQIDNYHKEKPPRRHDHDYVMDHLRKRVEEFLAVEGLFAMTEQAHLYYNQWLYQQQERMRSTHLTDVEKAVMNRTRASVLKLAMIYALARWDGQLLVIKGGHMKRAIRTVQETMQGVVAVSDFAYVTADTAAFEKVREMIKVSGTINRQALMRYASRRGVKTTKDLEDMLETLKHAGQIDYPIRKKPAGRGGPWPVFVKWKPRKIRLKDREAQDHEQTDRTPEPTIGDTTIPDDGGEAS